MQEHEENVRHRLAPKWWELLAYALIIAIALVFNAMQLPKWVVIPLVLAVLLVRAARIHLAKGKKAHDDV